jgi:uncharacterized membrane protein YhaH (DUF805 family)
MLLLPLLFDPRGAIDRRTFLSGLLQLLIIALAVWLGLTPLDSTAGLAALPALGEAFIAIGLTANIPTISLASAILVVAARAYVTVCLMLKRLRDAGKDSAPLVTVGLASLIVHVLLGIWSCDLFKQQMPLVMPLIADIVANTLIWVIFIVWVEAQPTRPRATIEGPAQNRAPAPLRMRRRVPPGVAG